MVTRSILFGFMASILWASPVAADPLQILTIPLEMPLNDQMDGRYLEGIFQEELAGQVRQSVLLDAPVPHMETVLSQDRQLQIWFSSVEDGNRIFWIQLRQDYHESGAVRIQDLLETFKANFGPPEIMEGTGEEGTAPMVLVRVDPTMPPDRQAAVRAALADSFTAVSDQLLDFGRMNLRERASLLGPHFRGAILTALNKDGTTLAVMVELIDLSMASTVFNLQEYPWRASPVPLFVAHCWFAFRMKAGS